MKRLSSIFYCLLLLIAFACTLTSCEKEVHISLASSPPQVVVEGAIETGLPPYVVLTSTISFFSDITLTTLQNSFVHGAVVKVFDGTNTITLREYTFDTGANNTFSVYSVDSSNLSNIMLGQVGKSYALSVTYNGVTYSGITKIPAVKGVDSMWFDVPTFQSDKLSDSAKQLFVNYTDPDTPGNYVRYFTKRNNEAFYPSGIFSDQAVNGKRVDDIGLVAGFENTGTQNGDSLRYFYPGDVITLKWCEIDKGVYTFWNSLQYANSSIGNPFSSPINVTTNMTNGAIGIWAGYGSIQYTKTVP